MLQMDHGGNSSSWPMHKRVRIEQVSRLDITLPPARPSDPLQRAEGSPWATARAAALIGEPIRIPTHLSLPPFDARSLCSSRPPNNQRRER